MNLRKGVHIAQYWSYEERKTVSIWNIVLFLTFCSNIQFDRVVRERLVQQTQKWIRDLCQTTSTFCITSSAGFIWLRWHGSLYSSISPAIFCPVSNSLLYPNLYIKAFKASCQRIEQKSTFRFVRPSCLVECLNKSCPPFYRIQSVRSMSYMQAANTHKLALLTVQFVAIALWVLS